MRLAIKRVYEAPAEADGRRILVDRIWPRGLLKATASVDIWLKDVAPSRELRAWFGHDAAKWAEFARRYRLELGCNAEAVRALVEAIDQGPATLIYSARDESHNQAVVLRDFLLKSHTRTDKGGPLA